MFTKDRRKAIQELLIENRQINVSRLSTQFGVSEVTIRKDLEYLESIGFLIRTHGGAVLKDAASPTGFSINTGSRYAENISKIAASLVNDGDVIYLGSDVFGTSIAPLLSEKHQLTVVTNNMLAAVILADYPHIQTIIPGGILTKEDSCSYTSGNDVTAYLSKLVYDKTIIGVDVINKTRGFLMRNSDRCAIYKTVLSNTSQKIICVNEDAFDKNALFQLAPLDQVDLVVSSGNLPEEYIEYFINNSIRVYSSYDLESIH